MTSIDVPRNTTQRAGNIENFSARVTASNTQHVYQCPTGKKARVTQIQMQVDALGSDATVHIALREVGGAFEELSLGVAVNGIAEVNSVTLLAGEAITDVGDSGATNSTVDMRCTIEEFSV